ncbi:MAG: hypothetical protein ABI333_22275 [bacterium]
MKRNMITMVSLLTLLVAACGSDQGVGGNNNGNDGNDNGNVNNLNNNNILPNCGDGTVDPGEACDDGALNSDTAPDACRTNCSAAGCGDGVVDTGELCDGAALDGNTCASEGYSAGDLTCAASCTLDDSGCTSCGDGVAEGTDPLDAAYESCDGTDFRGEDCVSLGHVWGALSCVGCQIVETGCHDTQPVCGNDIIESVEECDGTDLGGATCVSLGEGFTGGNLGCTGGCLLDRTDCAVCGNGVVESGEACDDGNTVDDLTCAGNCLTACGPAYAECNGDTSTFCEWDGSGVMTEYCDPLQGMGCNTATGRCDGVCAMGQLGLSYIGCDYYPTVTNNALLTSTAFHFSVAVSNSTQAVANVTVTQGANTITTVAVAANDVAVINLPWVNALKNSTTTVLVTDGAYRLRSDNPVTVYQYNPLEYTVGGGFSYTNDAALLLPVNTWTGNYMVASRNVWSGYPGLYAVTASEDNTVVTLTPSATGGIVRAGAGVAANGTGSVTLNQGDVLQVLANAGGGAPDVSDPTGTLITADKPVQVIGGHECVDIPYNVTWCDHIEESMPPLETLGDEYLVVSPLISAGTTKAMLVRVIATQPNTLISYEPPQAGAPTSIANAGSYFEIGPVDAAFQITASEDVIVVQYMMGQASGGGTGDPAMAIAVPTRQYRNGYLFHAPTNYEANYVNITAPTGATVNLDGAAVGGFTAIGTTGYSAARVQLSNTGSGNHNVDSTDQVGISVYGYGQYTSYWYPGGLNLID